MKKLHPAEQLALYMQKIYEKRLTTTSGGNLSIRDAEGNIWITPAAVDKGSLTPSDMVCVHPDGTVEGRHRPSSELPFHANIYRLRPDLTAVIHAHPPCLLAASMVRRPPDPKLLPAIGAVCGPVGTVAYAAPGSTLLGEYMGTRFAEGCDLVLLDNHGVCVGGTDLSDAFAKFEMLEYAAKLEHVLKSLSLLDIMIAKCVQMKRLGLCFPSVAEGVETKETLQVLKELDCDLIQGYYFDKPLFQAEFEQRLQNKQYPL